MSDYISKDWTVKELKSFIREETNSVNRRLIEYYASTDKPSPVVEQMRLNLVALATGKEQRHGGIALGLRGKTKAELIKQGRALQEFLQADIYTPEALRMEDDKFQDSYKTFTANRPDLELSQAEYKDLVETFGALDEHLLTMWGSEEIAMLYKDYKDQEEKPKDFIGMIIDVNREAKRNDYHYKEQYIDAFRRMLQ